MADNQGKSADWKFDLNFIFISWWYKNWNYDMLTYSPQMYTQQQPICNF